MTSRKVQFGLTLPNRGVVTGATTVEEMLALAEKAEATGWDSVWVGDSIFAKPRLDSLVLLGALAARTKRVKLELIARGTRQGAHLATLSVGKGTIQLLAPDGEGHIQHIITEKGEGPFALSFSVKHLEQTRTFLEQHGIKYTHNTDEGEKLILDPGETDGIGINFIV